MANRTTSRRTAAIDLADAFERAGITADQAADAAAAGDLTWLLAATMAGQPETPDAELRRTAVAVMRDREANPDPFASFTGAA
jgi:hypothetical protein